MIVALVGAAAAGPASAKGGAKPAAKPVPQPGTVVVVGKRAPRVRQQQVFAAVAGTVMAGGIVTSAGAAAPSVRTASPQ